MIILKLYQLFKICVTSHPGKIQCIKQINMTDSNADQGQDPQENDGICPYMFEPNKNDSNNEQLSYSDDDSTSTGEDLYSSDDSFEVINAWRRSKFFFRGQSDPSEMVGLLLRLSPVPYM